MRLVLALMAVVAWPDRLPAQVADKFVPAEPEGARYFGALGAALRNNLQQLLKTDTDALLAPFERRPFADARAGEAVGRFLWVASETYRYQKEQKLRVMMERVVQRLLATQETDGYLGTEAAAGRWKQWDLSVHKEVMNGLLAYARTVGDERSLAAAKRAAELLMATFGPAKRDVLASSAEGGWTGTALLATYCEIYKYTQDARFLRFAEHLVAAWDQPQGPRVVETMLGGSVKTWPVEALENLIGLLELYRLKGGEEYLLGITWAHDELAAEQRFTDSPWWTELNWHLLRLTARPDYARVLASALRAGVKDARLVALSPQFVAGAYASGLALIAAPEGTFSVTAAGRTVRLESSGKQVRWIEGEGTYPVWWLSRSGRPLYTRRKWTIGATYDLPE